MLIGILAYVTGVCCAVTVTFLMPGHDDAPEGEEPMDDDADLMEIAAAFCFGATMVLLSSVLGWL